MAGSRDVMRKRPDEKLVLTPYENFVKRIDKDEIPQTYDGMSIHVYPAVLFK